MLYAYGEKRKGRDRTEEATAETQRQFDEILDSYLDKEWPKYATELREKGFSEEKITQERQILRQVMRTKIQEEFNEYLLKVASEMPDADIRKSKP